MLKRLRGRQERQFATVLPRADAWLAALWWVLLVARGLLPALFAIAMGRLVGAAQAQENLPMPLAWSSWPASRALPCWLPTHGGLSIPRPMEAPQFGVRRLHGIAAASRRANCVVQPTASGQRGRNLPSGA